jgi:hypothetical protein
MADVNRRQFLQTAAAATAAAPFVACTRTRQPNVVFVLSDDLRWDCMGVAGHPFLKTPNIDRLATEGVRFKNAFCTSSLCSPSRASFLSGRYAHSHQVINNFTEFPTSIPSYPARLHDAGYHTAYIGKWHMGEGNDEKRPGFDYWASHKGQGQYYDTPFNVDGQRQVIKGYYSHVVTDLATDWLKKARRPFSLNLGHKAPHGLWVPEPKYEHAFDNVDVRKPATAAPGPGTPDWVSRRIKTWHGIDGPLYGTNDFGKFIRTYHETIPSVDDSVGAIYETLRSIPVRRRQRGPPRRARVDRQAHDVGGEHQDSAAGAVPGIFPAAAGGGPDGPEPRRRAERPRSLRRARARRSARLVVQGSGAGPGDTLALVVDVRIQLREGVSIHPQRPRRPHRPVELHALSER